MGDKRSVASYWNMKEELGRELHVHYCKTNDRNGIALSYRVANKSLARPGRKQARKHVRDARTFNNIETRDVIKFCFSARQGAEGNSRPSDRNISLFPS